MVRYPQSVTFFISKKYAWLLTANQNSKIGINGFTTTDEPLTTKFMGLFSMCTNVMPGKLLIYRPAGQAYILPAARWWRTQRGPRRRRRCSKWPTTASRSGRRPSVSWSSSCWRCSPAQGLNFWMLTFLFLVPLSATISSHFKKKWGSLWQP